MGAIFFFIFLALLFFVAMFFIILSVILLIIRNVRKRRGKTVKKRWLVIPLIILVINIIIAMLPVGYIAFLRYENTSNASKIIYAESGKSIYWPMRENGATTNSFDMDGTKYVRFREGFSDETYFLDSTDDKRNEPVANIRFYNADSNVFNDLMIFLLTGNTRDKLDVSTIYPLINENGFEFIEICGTAGNGVFCPQSKLDSIKSYYANISNYDTENLICDYSVYTDKEGSGKRGETLYIDIKNNITVAPTIFEELRQMLDSGQGIKRVDIPQKYIELDEAAQPGTPIFGYDERELFAYSKDKMAFKHVNLVLLDGQVFVEQGSGYNYINGCPLSDELNQYIIETIFVD